MVLLLDPGSEIGDGWKSVLRIRDVYHGSGPASLVLNWIEFSLVQHCFICYPSYSTVTDPRMALWLNPVETFALKVES